MYNTIVIDLKCLFFLMVITYHTIDANLCMENDPHLPRPRLVIIGHAGAGKSSLANSLMGRHPVDDRAIIGNLKRFKDGCFSSAWQSRGDVKTTDTCYDQGPFLGNLPRNFSRPTYPDVTVVDTPGFGDANRTLEVNNVRRLVEVLKNDIKCVDAFVICFNKNKLKRLDKAMANLLTFFQEMYGKSFWEHAILEFTFYAHSELNLTVNDEVEKKIEGRANSMLKRELDVKLDLKAIFIDSHYHYKYPEESVAFVKNAKRLFEFANSSKPLSTKGIDFVLTEFERKQSMVEDYRNKTAQLNKSLEMLEEDKNAELQRSQKKIEEYRSKTTELRKSLETLEKDKNAELQRKQTMIEDDKDTIENLTNTIENLENDLMNTDSQQALHATPILFGFGISMCILVTTMIG